MTPERAKELLPIITAFAEGKRIEWRNTTDHNNQTWRECSNPDWYDDIHYRIAPEPAPPKYRPMTSGGRCSRNDTSLSRFVAVFTRSTVSTATRFA